MGIRLKDLESMTPNLLSYCVKQFNEFESEKNHRLFEAARLSGYLPLSAWMSNPAEITDVIKFPWEKNKEIKLTKVTIKKRGT
jgi:hypothetical protein